MRIAKEFGQHLNTVDEIGRLIHLIWDAEG
jgi:hypothetical protein